MNFAINSACWSHYDIDRLQDLMEAHHFLFPDFERSPRDAIEYPPNARKDHPYCDPWGCLWKTSDNGIVGAVTEHPLADLDKVESFTPPDPEVTDGVHLIDWKEIERRVKSASNSGEVAKGSLTHGHLFLRLIYLAGYERTLYALHDDDPRIERIIEMIEAFSASICSRYLDLGVGWMQFPEDLGMQQGPMIAPDMFRRYIKPCYERLMKPFRDRNCIVHMHSDGDVRTLVDDLVDGGVDVLNIQDLVNGVEWIADKFAGRICIELDIDRQRITRFGTPQTIDALIKEEVELLGSKSGGLMMVFGLYPGTPIENVAALMDAMERYSTYYA